MNTSMLEKPPAPEPAPALAAPAEESFSREGRNSASSEVIAEAAPEVRRADAAPGGDGTVGTKEAPLIITAKVSRYTEDDNEDDDQPPGFVRRHSVVLVLGFIVVSIAAWFWSRPSGPATSSPVRKAAVTINVQLPPPPLPPPPPPPPPKAPETPREEQMEEQAPVVDESPPEPEPDNNPPPIGTNITGSGPADGFGLGRASGGGGNGSGRGPGVGGSRFGFYAAQVQNSIADAIKRHPKTRNAPLSVTARVWADSSGRIIRATLSGSSGDPAVDAALRAEVLTGLQLQSAPPAGMKMPINLRLTARVAR